MTTTRSATPGLSASPTIPQRFMRDPISAGRVAAPLRLFLGAAPDPTYEERDRLGRALMERDELGDALVRAVREDHVVSMPMFREALEQGIESIPDAPDALREFFGELARIPDWVDERKLAHGARVLRRTGLDASLVLGYGSLLGGYNNSGPLSVLMASGKLTGDQTLRRVSETSVWWRAVTAPGGLERSGEGWKLTVHVRAMHAFLNYQHEHDPAWRSDRLGLPINQFDQAGTLGLFSTTFLIHTRVLGIRYSERDADAAMHLWCYVGWLMGVDEHWLPFSEARGRRMIYHIGTASPSADANSLALAKSLIDSPKLIRHKNFQWIRRTYDYERGLSLATTLLGPAGVLALGVPMRPPWYPMWRAVANTVKHRGIARLPGGRRWVDARAERQLDLTHRRLLGGERPPIGRITHSQ
ncbi:oxygenase MpaB family protein [Rhodococcus sp. NPDC127528]|uniref:oxygenase MpaB family protein n=1 Tax=unclassified Rhodococcus (in: high G+C Gram-positive bacteria) TaxID=192944 RepID=UPI0036309267